MTIDPKKMRDALIAQFDHASMKPKTVHTFEHPIAKKGNQTVDAAPPLD